MMTQAKYEIETKLEREEGALELLQERMERSKQITKSMVAILDSFESRLARLESTIVPIYNETEALQRRQQNIDKTMASLDTVISFYSVSQQVEHMIRAGPLHVDGHLLLDPFIQALEKLEGAEEYFNAYSPESMELENVRSLFNSGGDALAREFKSLLHKHSLPVPPVHLLDVATADEESSAEDVAPPLHQFPEPVTTALIRIADWLMEHKRDEYMNVYAAVRSSILLTSIKRLRDHQKSASGGSSQNLAYISSPIVKQKFPGKKVSKRLQNILEKKANQIMLRASQTLEHSTGLTLGNRRLTAIEGLEDVVEVQEMENYLVCVMAVQKFIQSERLLMAGIIPLQHHLKVFEMIIKEAMDLIVQDGENIAVRANKCIARHEFAAVLVVFPILKQLQTIRPDFERTMEGLDRSIRAKFASILSTLHTTGEKALEDFIESVRNDTSSQLPKDGTVHELTSNVLVFLEQVVEYADIIAGVLAKGRVKPAGTPDRALLGNYMKRVLAQLNNTLVSKSEMYGDQTLKALFLLNNFQYILKALQRSVLLELVKLDEPECESLYHGKIQTNRKLYIQCWSKVLSYIYSSEDSSPNKFKDKDRAVIKEKFAGFNKEIEELSKAQRAYTVADFELRESLKRDNKELIVPKYNAFYDKYSALTFSKNPHKYIKYSPAQVSATIDRLFDSST